jgi:lipopolysaccharide export system protein LptA
MMAASNLFAQEIFWKGKELQSGNYKTIEGEITIRTPEDTIKASKAILYNKPKKAILKGNLILVRKGATVTGDSGIYYPETKKADILGHAVINTSEGNIRSDFFQYDLVSKELRSFSTTDGTANGIAFHSDRAVIYPGSKNIKLIGHAQWENDTIKGMADTIYLDKANGTMKMSKKAKIIFKKKKDEIAGSYIELDLNANKITRIEGSRIKRDDLVLKANKIKQIGEDYDLQGDVYVESKDSTVRSQGSKAIIKKEGMDMKGPTITRILDDEKKEIIIYAPHLITSKKDKTENYHFFTETNIRGQFDGYADSIFVLKTETSKQTFLYRNAHLQNDSLYIEGDTLELYQDSIQDIIKAKRNALMIMITRPNRVNTISGAYIQLTKTKLESELYADGESESFLWNDEKSNVGLNHTISPNQRAKILNKKISKVSTKGNTTSKFSPVKKVDYSYVDAAALKLKQAYQADSLTPGLAPVPNFLNRIQRKK